MIPRQIKTILWACVILYALKFCDCLNNYHQDQTQRSFLIDGEDGGEALTLAEIEALVVRAQRGVVRIILAAGQSSAHHWQY